MLLDTVALRRRALAAAGALLLVAGAAACGVIPALTPGAGTDAGTATATAEATSPGATPSGPAQTPAPASSAPAAPPASQAPSPGPGGGEETAAEASPENAGAMADPAVFAVPGAGIQYAFTSLDGLVACMLIIEPSPTTLGEMLEAGEAPGIYCMMTTPQEPDASAEPEIDRACEAQREEYGVGDLVGGQPVLTEDQVSVAACRSDVSAVMGGESGALGELSALPELRSGETLSYGDWACTTQQSGSLTCVRPDRRGWTVWDGGCAIG